MNDFLIAAMIRNAAQGEEGRRTHELIAGIAEHCAQIASKEGAQAPELIRQAFVYPTPTATAIAARVLGKH